MLCPLYSAHCTLHFVLCTLQFLICKPYSVLCTLCSVLCSGCLLSHFNKFFFYEQLFSSIISLLTLFNSRFDLHFFRLNFIILLSRLVPFLKFLIWNIYFLCSKFKHVCSTIGWPKWKWKTRLGLQCQTPGF